MKKTIRFGAAGVAMFAALGMSSVAHADTETATAEAEVLQALTLDLVPTTSVDFGAMVVSGAGSVSLDPSDGSLDCTAANITCSGTTDIADFTITGTASKAVTIILPAADVDLQHTDYGTADPLTRDATHVIEFSTDTEAADNPTTLLPEVTLDGLGDGDFSVGGSLNFDGGEVAGDYSATFTVEVEYT
jgi:hypothetical protein